MLYLIVGVSGSGKSEYAENLAVSLSAPGSLYYAATMEPYGAEGQARIERHRRLRAGKGFQTIERCRDITQIIGQIGKERCTDATILLESLSTLLANEMFRKELPEGKTQVTAAGGSTDVFEGLVSEMCFISRQCKHLIVVTDDVFSDGVKYQAETEEYMRQLGKANRALAAKADEAVEVVCGIPLTLAKNGLPAFKKV